MLAYKSYIGQSNRRTLRDRRKKPTPAVSRFTIWGRRRTFRRKIDRQKGGYVDQYSALIFFFVISAMFLNFLDILTTVVVLDLGGAEANPIVRLGLEVCGDKFWVWKFAIFSVCVVVFCLHCKFRRATLYMATVNVIYFFCVFLNVLEIILRMNF